MGQVRDLTPLREADGRLVALPALENALAALPGRDPQRPGAAAAAQAVRHQPDHDLRLAADRADRRGAERRSSHRILPTTVRRRAGGGPVRRPASAPRPGELAEIAVRITIDAGHACGCTSDRRRPSRCGRSTTTGRRCCARARRGNVYPYELTGPAGRAGRPVRRARPRRRRRAGAGGPAEGQEHRGHRRRRGQHADRAVPRGRHPGGAARRPDQGARRAVRAGVRAGDRRARPGRADARAGRVVRAVVGRADLDELRHREHGLGGRRAQADRRVHPGRRRDQHRGRRDQRRRPAVLERRGHDAHAHQGHPGDDAGLGDGAHRQAVAGLLRRRVGRGQLRHRRLRPGDGPQRPGAVLGAEPAGRPRRADGALRPHLHRAGRDRPAPGRRPATRPTATSPASRTPWPAATSPPSARSSPPSTTRTARSRSTSAR